MPAAQLAAVCADPRADAPRERFADFIARSEPATAAFVRAQLDLARRRRAAKTRDPEIERAAWSCGSPGEAHVARAYTPVVRLLSTSPTPAWAVPPAYGRGFVEACEVDGGWFALRGSELTALAPILDVCVHRLPRDATEFFDSPALINLRSIRFAGPPLAETQVQVLSASPYLARLCFLDLSRMELPRAALDALLCSNSLPSLRYLRTIGNRFPDINPTSDEEDGQVFGEIESNFAAELCAIHGPKPWLRGYSENRVPVSEAFG